jgi:hypothetical protein
MFGFAPRLHPLPFAIRRTDEDAPLVSFYLDEQKRAQESMAWLRTYSDNMRKTVNKRRRELETSVGDYVWVSSPAMGGEGIAKGQE